MNAERDVELWLASKLEDAWASEKLAPLLTPPILTAVKHRFQQIDNIIKQRLLFSFLFLRKPSLKENRHLIIDILQLASNDNDEWVRIVARLLGSLSANGDFQLQTLNICPEEIYISLKETLKQIESVQFYPLEAQYLNTNCLSHPPTTPHNPHFKLKKTVSSTTLPSTNKLNSSPLTDSNESTPFRKHSYDYFDEESPEGKDNANGNGLRSSSNSMNNAKKPSRIFAPHQRGASNPELSSLVGGLSERRGFQKTKRMRVIDIDEVRVISQHQQQDDQKKRRRPNEPTEEISPEESEKQKKKREKQEMMELRRLEREEKKRKKYEEQMQKKMLMEERRAEKALKRSSSKVKKPKTENEGLDLQTNPQKVSRPMETENADLSLPSNGGNSLSQIISEGDESDKNTLHSPQMKKNMISISFSKPFLGERNDITKPFPGLIPPNPVNNMSISQGMTMVTAPNQRISLTTQLPQASVPVGVHNNQLKYINPSLLASQSSNPSTLSPEVIPQEDPSHNDDEATPGSLSSLLSQALHTNSQAASLPTSQPLTFRSSSMSSSPNHLSVTGVQSNPPFFSLPQQLHTQPQHLFQMIQPQHLAQSQQHSAQNQIPTQLQPTLQTPITSSPSQIQAEIQSKSQHLHIQHQLHLQQQSQSHQPASLMLSQTQPSHPQQQEQEQEQQPLPTQQQQQEQPPQQEQEQHLQPPQPQQSQHSQQQSQHSQQQSQHQGHHSQPSLSQSPLHSFQPPQPQLQQPQLQQPQPQQSQQPQQPQKQPSTEQTQHQLVLATAATLFEAANKLTPQNRETIMQFLSGNKANPAPEEGPIKVLLLNEEVKQNSDTNTMHLESIIFEINYQTGTWRKLRRKKALPKSTLLNTQNNSSNEDANLKTPPKLTSH